MMIMMRFVLGAVLVSVVSTSRNCLGPKTPTTKREGAEAALFSLNEHDAHKWAEEMKKFMEAASPCLLATFQLSWDVGCGMTGKVLEEAYHTPVTGCLRTVLPENVPHKTLRESIWIWLNCPNFENHRMMYTMRYYWMLMESKDVVSDKHDALYNGKVSPRLKMPALLRRMGYDEDVEQVALNYTYFNYPQWRKDCDIELEISKKVDSFEELLDPISKNLIRDGDFPKWFQRQQSQWEKWESSKSCYSSSQRVETELGAVVSALRGELQNIKTQMDEVTKKLMSFCEESKALSEKVTESVHVKMTQASQDLDRLSQAAQNCNPKGLEKKITKKFNDQIAQLSEWISNVVPTVSAEEMKKLIVENIKENAKLGCRMEEFMMEQARAYNGLAEITKVKKDCIVEMKDLAMFGTICSVISCIAGSVYLASGRGGAFLSKIFTGRIFSGKRRLASVSSECSFVEIVLALSLVSIVVYLVYALLYSKSEGKKSDIPHPNIDRV